MSPKIKITPEMIMEAGFEIVSEIGIESLNVRNIAKRLNCSTQPVLYNFKTIEEIKRAVYERTDIFHTEYLMTIRGDDIMLGIGLNYIRFAINYPNLFRFLFQSGYAKEHSLIKMIDSNELRQILAAMGQAMETTEEKTKEIFLTIAMFAHGYACIIANNSLEFDEELAARLLTNAYRGAVLAAREEE